MEYLTSQQIAKQLNVTPQRVTGLIRAGLLKALPEKVGGTWLVLKSEFQRFQRRPRRGPGRPPEKKRGKRPAGAK